MNTQFKFKNFNYIIDNILTSTDITLAVNKFYVDELLNIDSNLKFSILFKVKTIDGD